MDKLNHHEDAAGAKRTRRRVLADESPKGTMGPVEATGSGLLYSDEDRAVLEALDRWLLLAEPEYADPGCSRRFPDAELYETAWAACRWCDAHGLDGGVFLDFFRAAKTWYRLPRDRCVDVGPLCNIKTLRELGDRAMDLRNRIVAIARVAAERAAEAAAGGGAPGAAPAGADDAGELIGLAAFMRQHCVRIEGGQGRLQELAHGLRAAARAGRATLPTPRPDPQHKQRFLYRASELRDIWADCMKKIAGLPGLKP